MFQHYVDRQGHQGPGRLPINLLYFLKPAGLSLSGLRRLLSSNMNDEMGRK